MKKYFNLLKVHFHKNKTNSRFILIGTQRSGTTYLSDLLNSHPYIYMGQELFKTEKDKINVDEDNYQNFIKTKDVVQFLDDYFHERLDGNSAVGFKIMLNHLEQFPEIIQYIKDKKIKCIYLERQNQLKIALSRFKARETQLYHTTITPNQQKIEIDDEILLSELQLINTSIKKLRKLSRTLNCHHVAYEPLVADKEKEMKKLLSYLKVQYFDGLSSSLKKINSDKIADIVLNYEDLKNALSGTRFSTYLDD